MSVMLTRFESKSNCVKGLAFHPTQLLFADALHKGGSVRGVTIHPSRVLLVTGGDDYKIKVWDYVRTVQFHHEVSQILSAFDDQTIHTWSSTSHNCITILGGHLHYVVSARFHPEGDLIVSTSMDQTIAQEHTQQWANNLETSDTFSTVKYVLEGHDRGVNFAAFHLTLPLIISAADA
ncbi:hypothetical protein PAXINDRAFT_154172 [Paxillus involutus ATCC 200175]|nr:hypothetical protein PAXINDRAFT_154172 [Paxillus involutus ATCC 200175]